MSVDIEGQAIALRYLPLKLGFGGGAARVPAGCASADGDYD